MTFNSRDKKNPVYLRFLVIYLSSYVNEKMSSEVFISLLQSSKIRKISNM